MPEVFLNKVSEQRFNIKGVLMMHTVMSVLNELANLLDTQSEVTIDFSEVDNSDSAAIALIVDWLAKAKQKNIKVHLVNLPQQLLDIARACDLLDVLPID